MRKKRTVQAEGWGHEILGGREDALPPTPPREEGTGRSAGPTDRSAPLTTKAGPGEGGGILERRGVPPGHEEGRVQNGGRGSGM